MSRVGPDDDLTAGRGEARRSDDAGPAGDLLAEAVDRIAHQIKNPLQAVAMNLEVIRMRIRKRAPELWAEVERYGDAVDENVSVLDRRLRLLLRLGRRSPDEAPESVDVAALVRDFAEALQLGDERPALTVRAEGEQLAARIRPGFLLALVLDLWRGVRSGDAEAAELTVVVRPAEGRVVLEMEPPPAAESGALLERWRETASAAGGRLEVGSGRPPEVARAVLPADTGG